MRRIKSKDTGPERAVRRILTGMGVRYRLHRKDLPGTPDLAVGVRKVAVFVHGCFWHGHDCKRGAREPKTNVLYWRGKIARNRTRDAAATGALEALGWRIVVVWECDLKAPHALADRLAQSLQARVRALDPG
jgi:DNA mismatch endonuclease (patch repair protein)